MFDVLIDEMTATLMAMTLAMARLFPCLLLVPVFAFREFRGMLRTAIVIALAVMPMPTIKFALVGEDLGWLVLVGLLFKESLIGFLIGLLLAMPFWMYESIGCLFDNQRGALAGGQINPALGDNTSELGHMFKQMLVMLLIVAGGYTALTQIIWESYAFWPPTQWFPVFTAQGLEHLLALLAASFRVMVLYAFPLVGLLLMIEFGMAVLNLYGPQLQVSILAMPVKSLVGLAFFVVYFSMLSWLGTAQLDNIRDLKHVLPLLIQAP
ncbi:type III secretion system export apparatus subunit SctT [Pseudomonas fluorescens]|uniref:type III secretion system export apparatus subunit SctT n=1 Tax=Pseudomonas fluorescens TaxID=294 RepID=UPI001BE5E0E7|nr:type III secretion system export apparatus subunit SctT [Pseudomonas fluorescens]MBT2375459.1 type III secretion system export apparatus subunit SctT [Pseudomonas fluorescens]